MSNNPSTSKVKFAFGSYTHSNPIFIHGILQRSGTNYLRNLLCLHPDCDINGPVWEDGLIGRADLLVRYAVSTYNSWDPAWNVQEKLGTSDLLCESIGNGLISFLNMQAENRKKESAAEERNKQASCPRRLVTKTPNVNNLEFFFKLFPNAHLLIIIRDGRSVVESGVRSFHWDYETKMRAWNNYAKLIRRFEQKYKNRNHKFLIVRYEDVYTNLEKEMRKIFFFLDLAPEKFDFHAATDLYVSGSSDLAKKEKKDVHWKPVKKSFDFNPIKRWRNWDRDLHERFNWIAGNMLESFGYTKEVFHEKQFLWTKKNIMMDMKWVWKKVKRRFHLIFENNIKRWF